MKKFSKVSKPYRYARKVHWCLFSTMYNIVSKPYRYARKPQKFGSAYIEFPFQNLIGMLGS